MTIPEQLRELLAKATPGDWQANGSHVYGPDPDRELVCQFVNWPNDDRELIVFLRNNATHFATLEEENVRLREALVTAMIPIEAILLSGTGTAHCKEVQDALHDAQNKARAALQEQPK